MKNEMLAMSLMILRPALMFLYAGPDQLLPLASLIGTIIGILMIGWQRVFGAIRTMFASVREKVRPSRTK